MINQTKETKKEKMSFPLLVLNIVLLSVFLSFAFMVFQIKKDVSRQNKSSDNLVIRKPVIIEMPKDIKAKAVYVIDLKSGNVILSKNENEILPLASLTKIMTAFTAMEITPKNKVISINKDFLKEEGDTGLLSGEKWRLEDLLNLTISASSNDGARSIASVSGAMYKNTSDLDLGREIFIQKMNDLAKQYNLNSLSFNNETGLDITDLGGVGSAKDISKLFEISLRKYPEVFYSSRKKTDTVNSTLKSHLVNNTNDYVSFIPNILASKTGFTDKAGGNLIVSFDAGLGRPIIITVLGSTIDDRFSDVIKIASSTINTILNQ